MVKIRTQISREKNNLTDQPQIRPVQATHKVFKTRLTDRQDEQGCLLSQLTLESDN